MFQWNVSHLGTKIFKAYASCRRPKGGTVWRLSEIWTVLRIFAFYVFVKFVLAILVVVWFACSWHHFLLRFCLHCGMVGKQICMFFGFFTYVGLVLAFILKILGVAWGSLEDPGGFGALWRGSLATISIFTDSWHLPGQPKGRMLEPSWRHGAVKLEHFGVILVIQWVFLRSWGKTPI